MVDQPKLLLLESGGSRTRVPVAAKIALQNAATNGGTPGSPTPQILRWSWIVRSCLSTSCRPLDTLKTSGREAAQNGKRTERIKRWLYWWNCVAAIWTPAPKPKWSRFASGKVPSTSPGVRNTSFLPSNVPPDQKVEFCSTIGQIFPLILY